MDLLNLEVFQAVAQQCSITQAAKLLNRAQSNVSMRIQQLEKQLETVLFLRDRKPLELTAEGKVFLAYSQKILALAAEAKQALHPHEPSGKLTLGAMESAAASRLPKVLAGFQQGWQQVELQVITGPSLFLLNEVMEYRMDGAFLALGQETLPVGLSGIEAFNEELMLIVPERYQGLAVDEIPLTQLACFREGCSYRHFAQNRLKQVLKLQEVGSYHAIIACVAAGSCVGVLPRSVLELQPKFMGISAQSLGYLMTYFVWRSEYNSPALQQFKQSFIG